MPGRRTRLTTARLVLQGHLLSIDTLAARELFEHVPAIWYLSEEKAFWRGTGSDILYVHTVESMTEQ